MESITKSDHTCLSVSSRHYTVFPIQTRPVQSPALRLQQTHIRRAARSRLGSHRVLDAQMLNSSSEGETDQFNCTLLHDMYQRRSSGAVGSFNAAIYIQNRNSSKHQSCSLRRETQVL